jgi:S1-C subfamily serine protease
VVVLSVAPDNKSRLKRGDVIIACNGAAVASPDELIRAIGTPKVGEHFTLRVVRGSQRFTLAEVQSPTAYLGANVKDATGEKTGAEVDAVVPKSPAAKADLQRGDVITAVDDAPVKSVDELLQILGTHRPGDTITISLSRESRRLRTSATLEDRPQADGSG